MSRATTVESGVVEHEDVRVRVRILDDGHVNIYLDPVDGRVWSVYSAYPTNRATAIKLVQRPRLGDEESAS